jgi:hypothetical protein
MLYDFRLPFWYLQPYLTYVHNIVFSAW